MNWQTVTAAEDELFKACTILFGNDVLVSNEFLYYIQPSGIKSAYRRRARETHPDTVLTRHSEQDGGAGTDRFIETNWAYNQLMDFIKRRDLSVKPFISATNRTRPKKRHRRQADAAREETGRTRPRGSYYRGEVPSRKLLFGQFLFYAGEVSWEALIKAIVWQRNQRPRIGDIAQKWGWATSEGIKAAMEQRQLGEHLGESLVRLRLLSLAQLKSLLNKQRTMQRPFGDYFVQNNFVSRARLLQLFRDFKTHNGRHNRNFSTSSRF